MPPKIEKPVEQQSFTSNFDLPKYDGQNFDVTSWLKFFNKKCQQNHVDEDYKLKNISKYLDGEAFNFYIETLQDIDDWRELEQKLLSYFTVKDSNLFSKFLNLKYNDKDDLDNYFKEKSSLANKLNLDTPLLLEALTEGMPNYLKKYLIAARVKETSDWIRIATQLKYSTNQEKQQPSTSNNDNRQNFQNRSYYPTRSRFNPNSPPGLQLQPPPRSSPRLTTAHHQEASSRSTNLPPYPCKICSSHQLPNQYHFHRDCPLNKHEKGLPTNNHSEPPNPDINATKCKLDYANNDLMKMRDVFLQQFEDDDLNDEVEIWIDKCIRLKCELDLKHNGQEPSEKKNELFKVDALVLDKLTNNLPTLTCPKSNLAHLKTMPLADPDYNISAPIDILIGAELAMTLFTGESVIDDKEQLTATSSKLGGLLPGRVSSKGSSRSIRNIIQSHHACLETQNIVESFGNWNPFLMPKIQQDLFHIILRFRIDPVALNADIAKMYRQIRISQEDSEFQRIVWRNDPHDKIKDYRLETVTYGTSCAPFLATRMIKQLSLDEQIDEGKNLVQELYGLLSAGGFELRKWTSNVPDVLSLLPNHLRSTNTNIGFKESKEFVNVAKIFDPLSWISPFTTTIKLIFQELWKTGLEWDDPIPEELRRKLTLINQDLPSLEHIQIPRCVVPGNYMKVEFHGFCDVSQKAYAASLYLKVIFINTSAKSFLLVEKTRVAPMKVVSLPKLELCSALLLARLVKTVYDNLPLTINEIYLWSDSTIALCWINSEPCRWKTFVANRVAEIHRLVSGVWCHVDGRQNPADCASRGIFPSDLVEHPLWWNGPPWLIEPALEIKKFINSSKEEFKEEEKNQKYFGTIECEIPSIVINCSSLTKLKCIIAWCLRFVNNSRMPSHSRNREPLTLRELNDALLTVVKCVQSIEFSKENHCLLSNKPIPNKSRIYNLCPFLDSRGIIRVGGRLKNVNVHGDRIIQVLLPRSHHLTTLIINNVHVHNLHSSTQATLATIRNIFWIASGRNVVRKILRTCMKCARFRKRREREREREKEAPFQLMGNLPFARINRSRPFLVTGIDFAGPFLIKRNMGRTTSTINAYVALFICFSTRAIHLELISSLTISTIRRFIARRGKPATIHSDNATNFVGAHKIIGKLCHNASKVLTNSEGIQWKFIPPSAPHFGGLWEAGALTPGHFLIGGSLTALPDEDDIIAMSLPNRWQLIQKSMNHFWTRWSQEYMSQLQQRSKWCKPQPNIKEGSLVLIKNEQQPPLAWKIGRISKVFPGDDARIRVVEVKTANGTYRRPIGHLNFIGPGPEDRITGRAHAFVASQPPGAARQYRWTGDKECRRVDNDLLKLAFGNENLNKPTTFKWFSRFENRMESVKDEKRVGRPILHRNPEKPTTFRWFSRFENGMESVKDEKRVGRPILHRNPEKVSQISNLIIKNPRIGLRDIEEETGISKPLVGPIIEEDLQLKKTPSKIVPRMLTIQQKENRVEVAKKKKCLKWWKKTLIGRKNPKYPRSNGQVERTIQTIKGLIIKAVKSGRDPNLALTEFNNTPKYDLPSPPKCLWEDLDHQQKYAGSPNKILRPLEVGDNIMLQEKLRTCVPATVTAKHETPRSYMVKTPSGSEYRRNRSHLRPRKFRAEDSAPTIQSPSTPGSQAGTAMDDNTQDHGRPTSENRRACNPREEVAKKGEESSTSPSVRTRSGRTMRKPLRYRD
ncbi:hypothetical protein LAZ67_X002847 [Cordylochernes scorpioides]|uniref:Integrase catalytic domain-containing protein n=1 Tax=Cordylochernes scorpioides TaxID=51811 RepID=A0ABY6LVU1_9ARAC|nr:hypothetical protein LAZ67_X002847 [Cordylochernes scorpioides]